MQNMQPKTKLIENISMQHKTCIKKLKTCNNRRVCFRISKSLKNTQLGIIVSDNLNLIHSSTNFKLKHS
jgi:hypothetical protein